MGVARDASADEIKRKYRKLAKERHPDRNQDDPDAQAKFAELSAAYEILSDAEKRAQYDQFGHANFGAGMPGGGPTGFDFGSFDFGQIFGQRGAGGMGGAGGFDFGDLFGRGAQRASRGGDVEADASIGFVEALRGCERSFRVSDGRGGTRSLRVRIPAGIRDGGKVRLRGQGQPGAMGGPNGDLLLKVSVGSHPWFWREANDSLHVRVPISWVEAYAGAKVDVPTPTGSVSLRIPAGSQGGAKLRLRGKGVKRGKGAAGDLFVHLEVHGPKADEPAVQQALESIAEHMPTDLRDGLSL